jgi:Uma2 family endonuclease
MAVAPATDVRLHPLSVEDYHRMIGAGILTKDDRIELLDGMLVEKVTENPPHRAVVDRLNRHFARGVSDDLMVRVGGPITLPPRSEPEPDLAVINAADVNFAAHPGTAHLLIEVSDSSRRIDRGRKLAIYARAGLPEYWIVDLVECCVEVHRSPEGEAYAEVLRVSPGESVTPSGVDAPPLDVGALLSDGS